ncbi:MAG: histidine kinase dimerization/phospho-acceptor domain-containing protein [Paracoccaceae bacterium]
MPINNRRGPGAMPAFTELNDEMIAAAILNGRRLRAEATRDMFLWLWRRPSAVGEWLRSARPQAETTPRTHDVLNSLSALRASAEVLRDNPEIEPDQRRRLLDIVLSEEARLERLVGQFEGGARARASGAV